MKRSCALLSALFLCFTVDGQTPGPAPAGLGILAPTNGTVLDTSLTAMLRWQYPALGAGYASASKTLLQVSSREDLSARDDRSIVAQRRRHPAQQHLSVRELYHIGLAVEPRIVRGCPDSRNEFLSFANRAGFLSRSFADRAGDFGCATANLALADVRGLAILHHDDFSEVMFAPSHRPSAVSRCKLLPQNVGKFSVKVSVFPKPLGELQAGAGTIHLSIHATGRPTRHRARPIALKADFLVGPWASHLRRRGIGGHSFGGGRLPATGEQQRAKKTREPRVKCKTPRKWSSVGHAPRLWPPCRCVKTTMVAILCHLLAFSGAYRVI